MWSQYLIDERHRSNKIAALTTVVTVMSAPFEHTAGHDGIFWNIVGRLAKAEYLRDKGGSVLWTPGGDSRIQIDKLCADGSLKRRGSLNQRCVCKATVARSLASVLIDVNRAKDENKKRR